MRKVAETPKTPPDSDETLEALKRRIEASPELAKIIASRQVASNAFQQATNPNPPRKPSATLSALRDEVDRASKTMDQAAELLRRRASKPPSPKQEPTGAEKWLLVLSGLGDVILALIGGTQAKLWVSLVMLVAACGIQILVILKVQPFRARKWNVLLGFAVVATLTLLWWGARPEPLVISNQDLPKSVVVHDPVVQVTRIHISTNTEVPFQPERPIGINFVLGITGTPENVHIHVRARFVPTLEVAKRQKLTDSSFEEIYKEIAGFNNSGELGSTFNADSPEPYFTALLKSPSKGEIDEFNANQAGVLAIVRIEYNYTHWYERCVVFTHDHMDELITQGRTVVNNCEGNHNRSGLHPLGRLF